MRQWPEYDFHLHQRGDYVRLSFEGLLNGNIIQVNEMFPKEAWESLQDQEHFKGRIAIKFLEYGMKEL